MRCFVAKVEEAKEILRALGMPNAQQNDNAAYTLLAFTGLGPRTPWSKAKPVRNNPHGVIEFAGKKYKKIYRENTRESIRRQAIHQFEQGGILVKNPDDPGLATNSPRTHYALSTEALEAIRTYGTATFETKVKKFLKAVGGGLAEKYARRRTKRKVPVTLTNGKTVELSPGKHNQLQKGIVEEFLPRFVPGARLLYLGDTAHKALFVAADELEKLGIPMTKHDKLPDVVAFDPKRKWLVLAEAVTSHGPVSPKRHLELEKVLSSCSVGRVYVSAFPDFREFKKHAADIAWETEVWLSDSPGHLLHYNGDRFLGPR
jgi:type II restriction enzyme